MIARTTRQRLRQGLLEALEEAGVPAGPINSVAEAFVDPQIVHQCMKLDMSIDDGRFVLGVRLPFRSSRSALAEARPFPRRLRRRL